MLKVIGQRIRDLRKQLGLSQEQLAEIAGLHFSYIGGIERGEKNVTILNLEKIATALGVPFFDLFLFGKYIRPERNEKDILMNQLLQRLMMMKPAELRKVELLLKELFQI